MKKLLDIKGLNAYIGEKDILNGVDLEIKPGEFHVIMGPNGSGKSTLANVIMGNPKFEISGGTMKFNGKPINDLSPEQRSHLGIFLAFQYPREIAGVQLDSFLFMAYQAKYKAEHDTEEGMLSVFDFNKNLKAEMSALKMNTDFAQRSMNQGFSGGEKKKAEMLQLAMLKPSFVILDETDSGLDVDALKIVAQGINRFRSENTSALIVTHYQRILEYVKPDVIHVMVNGKIVKTGGPELAAELEATGYDQYIK